MRGGSSYGSGDAERTIGERAAGRERIGAPSLKRLATGAIYHCDLRHISLTASKGLATLAKPH
jgi:hypothetical protein